MLALNRVHAQGWFPLAGVWTWGPERNIHLKKFS